MLPWVRLYFAPNVGTVSKIKSCYLDAAIFKVWIYHEIILKDRLKTSVKLKDSSVESRRQNLETTFEEMWSWSWGLSSLNFPGQKLDRVHCEPPLLSDLAQHCFHRNQRERKLKGKNINGGKLCRHNYYKNKSQLGLDHKVENKSLV